MITQMRKLTFLVTNKEYENFIEDIRKLGVVHVDLLQAGATSAEFENAKALDARFDNAFKTLDFAAESYKTDKDYKMIDVDTKSQNLNSMALGILDKIDSLTADETKIKHTIDAVEKDIAKLEPWGEFDKERFNDLRDNGYQVNCWACPSKFFKAEWRDDFYATPVNEVDKKIFFLTFSQQKPDITAEYIDLPDKKLSVLINEKKSLDKQLEDVHEDLLKVNGECRESLKAAKVLNENEISLSKVHLSAESVADDYLKLMVGWVPLEKEEPVLKYLEENKIFFEEEQPKEEDNVPVEIKNDKYSSLFEPILKMYSLPSYRDLDVTPFFAPFFMLFFGLCLGDAGYGLIVLAASIFLFCKSSEKVKPYAKLGIYLGATTVVCGLLTGTFFGIDLSQQSWAFLAPVKKLFITDKNFTLFGYSPMMVISVIIGLIQVLLGMVLAGMKAAKLHGWKYAIGKISWVVAIITAIVAFGLPACGVNFPQVVTYVLYGIIALALIGIFFVNSPGKNIFMNFGTGLWDTYGMATGLLGDLLSYIRLFALGLTGGVLGSVFNQLAFDMTSSMSWAIRWLPMLIILLFGHGINFALCMISSFVHPMRLTFVEFFKNADFEGGGKAYEPFKIKKYQQQAES